MLPASHCVLAGRVRLYRPLAFLRGGGHRLRLGDAPSGGDRFALAETLSACVPIEHLARRRWNAETREMPRWFAARETAEPSRRLAARDTAERAMVLGTTAAAREASPEE